MNFKNIFIASLFILIFPSLNLFAQEDEELILYYQMEPLDDSLFIKIQQQYFIDPPDPKAEIVVDLRSLNDQTISIKGTLYPFLALDPEFRALVITYPFKLNLEETIDYGSVFTNIIKRLRFDKIINTPSVFQISPTLGYINPYFQLIGGERLGFAIKKDIGFSIGLGTPYSGVLETNFLEVNFHILGLRAGIVNNDDTFISANGPNNHNNIYFTDSWQINYTLPFGNFFEFGYFKTSGTFSERELKRYLNESSIVRNPDSTILYQPFLVQGAFYNWEFRYPIKILESIRGKIYLSKFLNEIHVGFTGRELSFAGSVFDFRFDAMVSSRTRQARYVIDVMVQKVFDYYAYSAIAIGPSIILGTTKKNKFGLTSAFFNLRFKIGSSL
ncbi:MAG: hypothetical protein DRQ01_03745 [Ignavibacteriae bacterium]|nr:MAG: hypothetical protein DRQ01_03745 [Ignavibacteriota bacterium]